jgi:AcrR family transcriptional regulator
MSSSSDLDPRDRKQQAKRSRILRAALEVCARSGIPAARMEEVAALAQVSKGTLYRFFESREDLLLAATLEAYESALRGDAVEPDARRSPRERLAHHCDGLAAALAQVAAMARVHYQAWAIAAATPVFEDRLLGFLRRIHTERHARCEALVIEGQEAGVFRADVSPRLVADALSALLAGFIYRATFDARGARPGALRGCIERFVLASLEVPAAQQAPESGRL